MGILSSMAMGGIGGAGRGVADYGLDLMRQADLADRTAMAMGRDEFKAGLKAGQQAGAKPSPAQQLNELADALLGTRGSDMLQLGGMAPGEAQDAASIRRGVMPMVAASLDSPDRRPDRIDDLAASGQTSAQVPKYTEGQSAQLMERSRIALRRAIGLTNPGSLDDIAKAEGTEQTTGFLARYAQGDTQAGRAALAATGKTTYGASGDEMTGAVPPGSLAESQVRENNAQANAANAQAGASTAHAGLFKAQVKKIDAEISGELQKGATQERMATMLNSLNALAKDSELDDADRKRLTELRLQITDAMRAQVAKRDGGGGGAGGGKPSKEAVLQQARDAIARGADRNAVIRRLKGMGVDPKGL